jgi:uncharacterized protein (DUF433 family)
LNSISVTVFKTEDVLHFERGWQIDGVERRLMSTFKDRITINPSICHGSPTVRGLRYPVDMILDLLSSGMTVDEILDDYEDLEHEDILAVLAYAARLSRVKRLEPLPA